MKHQSVKMWKGRVVASLIVSSPESPEESDRNLQSGLAVSQLQFELGMSQLQVRSVISRASLLGVSVVRMQ